MNSPVPSDALPPDNPKLSRRKRRWLIAGIVVALLVPGFYLMENYSGPRALKKVVAEYEAAGLSLDPFTILAAAVPAEENFGATPLLDGIMHPDDGSPAGRVAVEKKKRLKELLPHLPVATVPAAKRKPAVKPAKGSASPPPPPAKPAVSTLPDIFADKPEWEKIRAFLDANTICRSPPGEPSAVRAVYQALDAHRAVFDELTAAARRSKSFFTPAPVERIAMWRDGDTASFTDIVPMVRLLALRANAASLTARHDEAISVLAVLWKLRSASLAESTLLPHLVSGTIEMMWMRCARTILRTPGLTYQQLAQLAAMCGGDWSPEKELVNTFRGESAFVYAAFPAVRAKGPDQGNWAMSRFHNRILRFGPSGWLDQNYATMLERRLSWILIPLQRRGYAELPATCRALDDEASNWMEDWSPYHFSQGSSSDALLARILVWRSLRTRLTFLAIAMERHRLKHGRYPASASALVPGSIAALPQDIDGAPLRIVTSPDGASAVIYSTGWNLTDDWHGAIPVTFKEEDEGKNDDWPMALPFPPLPPP